MKALLPALFLLALGAGECQLRLTPPMFGVTLWPDGSGTVMCATVVPTEFDNETANHDRFLGGVERAQRVVFVTRLATADFDSIDKLTVGDIEFTSARNKNDATVRVTLPMAMESRWCRDLGPSLDDLARDRRFRDSWPKAASDREPPVVRLALQMPGLIASQKVLADGGKVDWKLDVALSAGEEKTVAELHVPLAVIRAGTFKQAVWEVSCGPVTDGVRKAWDEAKKEQGERVKRVEAARHDPVERLKKGDLTCSDPRLKGLGNEHIKRIEEELALSDASSNLVHALAHISTDEGLAALMRQIETKDRIGRARGISFLGHFDRPSVRKDLLARLEKETDIFAWTAVLTVLGELKESGALPRLIEDTKDSVKRFLAVDTLGAIGDPEAIPVLEDLYKGAEGFELHRASITVALARCGSAKFGPALDAFLKSKDRYVRQRVARYFLTQGDFKGADAFLELITGESSTDAWYMYVELRTLVPDLPVKKDIYGDYGQSALRASDGRDIADWFRDNRSKLVFDPATKTFKLK